LDAGHTIAIFPEGTLTREPDLWPMRGKTGAVRLALETNVPVYPIAHWGSEQILPQYGSKFRPGFWKPVDIVVGDEIDLSRFRGKKLTSAEVHQATEIVMTEITHLVEGLRGQLAPRELWDPIRAGQTETGNFNKKEGK
jgi:1-acyl-sn-glycerol-3-phosphate acyltransferase